MVIKWIFKFLMRLLVKGQKAWEAATRECRSDKREPAGENPRRSAQPGFEEKLEGFQKKLMGEDSLDVLDLRAELAELRADLRAFRAAQGGETPPQTSAAE